jgi:hypothetical protein
MISVKLGSIPRTLTWPGLSNSGMTLIPRVVACATIVLTSSAVYTSSSEKAQFYEISGYDLSSIGKLSSSTMCQWNTLNLASAIAARIV